MQQRLVKYSTVRNEIGPAYLLAHRGQSSFSWLISKCIGSETTHVDMAVWAGNTLLSAGMLYRSEKIRTLSSDVRKYPGTIDVYRPNALNDVSWNPAGAAEYMLRLCDVKYGRVSLVYEFLYEVVFTPVHVKIDVALIDTPTGDGRIWQCPALPPFCSMGASLAYELGGGVDPVPERPNLFTPPDELAASDFFEYLFTLMPD